MKILTPKEWLTAFVLPLTVGLMILLSGYLLSRNWGSEHFLYYDIQYNQTNSARELPKTFGIIRIVNASDDNLTNVDLRISPFSRDASNLEIKPDSGKSILTKPINSSSIDDNNVLRVEYLND